VVKLQKGDTMYYVRILKGEKEILKVTVSTIYDNLRVVVRAEKSQAYLISWNDIDKYLYKNRADALEYYNLLSK
jgi:hypothetical protein